MEVLVFYCLIAAIVVFILERFFLKDQPYLKWVAMGCIAVAALLKVVHTIETLVIVCLLAAVVVVILKLFVLADNEYLKWIAIGCIAVAGKLPKFKP